LLPHQCDAADGQFGFPFVMWKNAAAVLFGSLALPRAHGEPHSLRANDPIPCRFYSVYWKGVTNRKRRDHRYLSSQTSSMRQLLMMLLTIIVQPFTGGCQQ